MQFPQIKGQNIDGQSFTLPADFGGALNIVSIAFLQEHQADVNTWVPFFNTLQSEQPDLAVYELPTVKRGTWLFRRMVDYWMSSGISDPHTRATTITLYTDVQQFMQTVGLPVDDRIYILIVDRAGNIHWRTEGRYAPEKAAELTTALAVIARS